MKQSIRIIGGLYRGKKLQVPTIEGLRPTPDRVRETLFNWLMQDIRDARCLDAFAGSGALGFEAYSRGAGKVVLVEYAQAAYNNLQQLARTFNSPNLSIVNADACDYLTKTTASFDIVFLDPPFAEAYLPQCMDTLANTNVLVPGGLLYIEAPNELDVDPSRWEQLKLKQAGTVIYGLYRKSA